MAAAASRCILASLQDRGQLRGAETQPYGRSSKIHEWRIPRTASTVRCYQKQAQLFCSGLDYVLLLLLSSAVSKVTPNRLFHFQKGEVCEHRRVA